MTPGLPATPQNLQNGQQVFSGMRSHHPLSPQGCIGRGIAPPHLQGTQPMLSHCLPDAKCQARWHL